VARPGELMLDRGWDFSCPDWETRLQAGESLIPELPLDAREAERAVGIFNMLRLPDVMGTPTLGEAAGDWIREIVAAVFGSVDAGGVRRVKELLAMMPKKSSKTTNGAAIMMVALMMNRRPNAEFLLFGPTQQIADRAFDQAAGMVKADKPEEGEEVSFLQSRFKVREHLKVIEDLKTGATLKVLTFDMNVATGCKPAGVLVDELHLLSSKSYADRVIGQIRGGLEACPEGFLIFITTQSDEPPSGVFKAELQLARGIRDGRITGPAAQLLPVLYEFPEAMQIDKAKPWADPANWHMVMPNLNRPVTIEAMTASFAQAKEKGEEEIRRWASQHLNVQIGMALHSDRWRGADFWEDAGDPSLTLPELLDRCEVAVVGIDGGGLDDLFGLTVCGRDAETRDWLYWSHGWAQRGVLELRKDIAEKLLDFERDGDLTICDTGTDIVGGVVDICLQVRASGKMAGKLAIGLDPVGIGAVLDALAQAGFDVGQGGDVVGVSQGFKLASAVWSMEFKLNDGTAWHSGAPMMAWCVSNAKAEQRGNAVLITKQTAGKAKIDPLISAFNATKLMEANPAPAGRPSIMVLG
jgi:phage terminase large subunit-like protein